MGEGILEFYDDLAEHYHLIFENWDRSITRQANILSPLLEKLLGRTPLKILACACGIGTQTIGLALRGHILVASDLSSRSVIRAQKEAKLRGVEVQFAVADMRNLASISETAFDAVLAADNALPHLLKLEDLEQVLRQMASKLKPSGVFLASVRDYDTLVQTHPAVQPPAFFSDQSGRRIVHQVWDWEGDEYTVHLYLTLESAAGWTVKHYASRYRAFLRSELSSAIARAGFVDIRWLEPDQTSFYQPIVIARKGLK